MSGSPTYPGVYIEEVPSGVRSVVGVATSITAFVGAAPRGVVNHPFQCNSFGEFEREFGGLSYDHPLTYAVYHFFQNGGGIAIVVRAVETTNAGLRVAASTAEWDLGGGFVLEASSPGSWSDSVDVSTEAVVVGSTFNITATEYDGNGTKVREEVHRNLSLSASSADFVTRVLEEDSRLVRLSAMAAAVPGTVGPLGPTTAGADGTPPLDVDITGVQATRTGMYALDNTDIFNLLVLPSTSRDGESTAYGSRWATAMAYCQARRAILLIDALSSWSTVSTVVTATAGALTAITGTNTAVYFPWVKLADPMLDGRVVEFPPAGAVAGIIARTDAQRGVWKAPAGLDAKILGSRGTTVTMTDSDSGTLNPLGVNCLRDFSLVGTVVWGARTGVGADRLASEWKYLSIRRTALYIEESLFRGLQWVVFESNDEPLWSQIRLNVGAFMHGLFRQGAFQGTTPKDAYLVKCDRETTTQDDINRGIVNVVVGFAPLKPAEFVIIKLQQLAGQVAA